MIVNSITKAAKKLKIRREHIRDCLNIKKHRRTSNGFRFEFLTKEVNFNQSEDENMESLVEKFKLAEQREHELRKIKY